MKKYLSLIILVIVIFSPLKVNAYSTSISAPSSIISGQKFNVTVNVVNINDMYGLSAVLNYDKNKLKIIGSSGISPFSATVGSSLIVDSSTPKTGTFGFAKLTFQPTSSFVVGQSVSISLSSVVASVKSGDLGGSGTAKSIKMISNNNNLSSLKISGTNVSGFSSSKTSYSHVVPNNISSIIISATASDSRSSLSGLGTKKLKVYSNVFSIVVTAENGAKKTYKVTVYRRDPNGLIAPLSTDATLKNIVVKGYSLTFSPGVYNYDLKIPNNINKLIITATPNSDKAKVNIDHPEIYKVGNNVVEIKVTAEDGSIKSYKININRSNDGPTTTLDQLTNVLENTTAKIVNVDIKDKRVLSTKQWDAIIKSKKQIVLNYYSGEKISYQWTIDGKKLSDFKELNTIIKFSSQNQNQIDEITNYAEYVSINLAHNGALPKNTSIQINVSDFYSENDKIKLYYFDNNKLKLINDQLIVKGGMVTLNLDHASEYILTKSSITNNEWITYLIIVFITIIISSCLTLFIYRFLKKKRKN